jgi:hypothetical protein
LFKQVVGPLAPAKARFPPTSTIWAFFLEPWPYAPPTWIFPKFAGSRTSPVSALPIWPRPADPPLDFSKNFCYNKRKNTDRWRRRLENLKNFCYNIIIIKKGKIFVMELYEALKSGTSAEDLEAAFRKELAAAQEKIATEQNKEAEAEHLKECRDGLSMALYDYICALVGEEKESLVDIDEIEEKLLECEQEMEKLSKLTNKLKTFKVPEKFVNNDDDVIIKSFLNLLR